MCQLFIKLQLTMKLTMKFLRPLFVLLYLVVVVRFDLLNAKGIPSMTKCGKVYLTVSSLRPGYIEMNWIPECKNEDEQPDTIALYDRDPRIASRPIKSILTSLCNDGYHKTSIKFSPIWLPAQWEYYENLKNATPGSHCMPFWIASIRKNKIIDMDCLMIRPTWMADNRSVLGTIPIGGMIIPGTHNSGAYSGVPDFLKGLILNQEVDLWTQLVFGIRYLDLRIGYFGERFYVNHDLVRVGKLIPMLKHIREFSQLSPKEIIILDFHRFPYPQNFNDSIHKKLLAVIHKELGHLVVPSSSSYPPKGPSLNQIWATNKTIIICYANRQIAREHQWLWDPLPQQWGNKQNVPDLKDYLINTIRQQGMTFNPNPVWALMAELTMSPLDIIFYSEGNRALADRVNRDLTKWFRDEWYREEINVVATDYFLGNDMINVAIEINKLK